MTVPEPAASSRAAMLALLIVRGVLLWVVIPLGLVVWVGLTPWVLPRRISLGQFWGWLDLNLVAGLHRSIFRAVFATRLPWVGWNQLPSVQHRVGILDPW